MIDLTFLVGVLCVFVFFCDGVDCGKEECLVDHYVFNWWVGKGNM